MRDLLTLLQKLLRKDVRRQDFGECIFAGGRDRGQASNHRVEFPQQPHLFEAFRVVRRLLVCDVAGEVGLEVGQYGHSPVPGECVPLGIEQVVMLDQ